jgi:hypothetical protein
MLVEVVQLDPLTQDWLVWHWTPYGQNSSCLAYAALF